MHSSTGAAENILDQLQSLFDTSREILIDDAQLCAFNGDPFALRPRASHALIRSWTFDELRAVPNLLACIDRVVENGSYRCWAPRSAHFAFAETWRRNILAIQFFRNPFQREAVGKRLEYCHDDRCFSRIDDQAYTFSGRFVRIPETPPAGMESIESAAFEPSVCLLGQFFDVQRIDEAMNGHQDVGLFVCTVDSLGDGNEAKASEAQLIGNVGLISLPARQTARVVDQENIELARPLSNHGEQSL